MFITHVLGIIVAEKMDKKIILEIPIKETLYFKKEIKEDPNTIDYKLKEYGIKKLYHELPMSRKQL